MLTRTQRQTLHETAIYLRGYWKGSIRVIKFLSSMSSKLSKDRSTILATSKEELIDLTWITTPYGDMPEEIVLLPPGQEIEHEHAKKFLRTYKERRLSSEGISEIAIVYREAPE